MIPPIPAGDFEDEPFSRELVGYEVADDIWQAVLRQNPGTDAADPGRIAVLRHGTRIIRNVALMRGTCIPRWRPSTEGRFAPKL